MTLAELLNRANKGYPDGFLAEYFDEETGERNRAGSGDTLAEFIVIELSETFEGADETEQTANATARIESAIRELQGVIDALDAALMTPADI